MAWSLLVLTSLNDVELEHLILHLALQFIEVNDELVAILVERWPVLALHEAIELQLLVDHQLDLLHGFEDQVPRLDVEDVAQAVRDVEERLADQHVPLSDHQRVF